MRQLIVNSFLTLDGVMQAPGGPEEDPSGGFEHGGWSFGYWDTEMQTAMGESMSKPFDLVLGRKTYEIFAAHWPYSNEPGAEALNNATKHVASTTLTRLEWQNPKLIEDDVPDGVRALKEQHGLVDEFRIWTFPLVLGEAKRLFEGGAVPEGLELTSSQVSSTGVTIAAYRTGADIKSGSFVPEMPSEAELARRAALER